MTEQKRTVNYTDEDTARLISLYMEHGNDGLDTVAELMNKSVRSVRSKLVREGAYVASPKAKRATEATEGPSKKELLNDLETIVGFDVTGFSGATKTALSTLIKHLRAS